MATVVGLMIQLVSGGLGGMVAGKLLPGLSLGDVGDIAAGFAGGVGMGQLLQGLGCIAPGGVFGLDSALVCIVVGIAGGGALMIVLSLVRKLFR